jgi:hypothetical protein
MNIQYSIILAFMGQMRDRFATYQEPRGPGEKFALASKIERQLSQWDWDLMPGTPYAERLLDKFGRERLCEMIRQRDVIQVFDKLQKLVFGESLS